MPHFDNDWFSGLAKHNFETILPKLVDFKKRYKIIGNW